MGQNLAIGLAYEMRVPLSELRQGNISKKELRQEMEQSLLFDMSLYEASQAKKMLFFTLKNQVLETDLIPFLEAFYPMVYQGSDDEECKEVLKKLRSLPVSEWLDMAEEADLTPFQYDRYAESQYITFSKAFQPEILVDCEYLMLYYGNGKIITEGIDDFLHLFKQCIHATFHSHPIAKSMQVYISG